MRHQLLAVVNALIQRYQDLVRHALIERLEEPRFNFLALQLLIKDLPCDVLQDDQLAVAVAKLYVKALDGELHFLPRQPISP